MDPKIVEFRKTLRSTTRIRITQEELGDALRRSGRPWADGNPEAGIIVFDVPGATVTTDLRGLNRACKAELGIKNKPKATELEAFKATKTPAEITVLSAERIAFINKGSNRATEACKLIGTRTLTEYPVHGASLSVGIPSAEVGSHVQDVTRPDGFTFDDEL